MAIETDNSHNQDGATSTENTTSAPGEVDTQSGNEARRAARLPGSLKLAALAVVVAGGAYLLVEGLREPPMLERNMAGQVDGYRLETGRPTPPAAETLSEKFVAANGVLREKVLQRLSEFRATWKVADPQVTLTTADVSGNANAFAEQLEGWFEQYNLLGSSAVENAPDMASIPGATLPAPPVSGFLIRCREEDDAIARDLVMALAPVVDGEVNIVFDERVSASRLQIAIVGAPRFDKDGIAFFQGS